MTTTPIAPLTKVSVACLVYWVIFHYISFVRVGWGFNSGTILIFATQPTTCIVN